VQLRATTSGITGIATVTVQAVPVASVTVTPDSAEVKAGQKRAFTAVLRAANGTVLSRPVVWTSDTPSVVTVTSDGIVIAVSPGTATIRASSEGKEGTATVTVFVLPAVTLSVTPQFTAVTTGTGVTLHAAARDRDGDTVPAALITWSGSTVTGPDLTLTPAGGITAVAASLGALSDTAIVAGLPTDGTLTTAFPDGNLRERVTVGAQVRVPVTLDLSHADTTGRLGSVSLSLGFDAAALRLDSTRVGVSGAAATNLAAPGELRFAFAASSPQGRALLTLFTAYFTVLPGSAGKALPFVASYAALPTTLEFSKFTPLVVGGLIRVVP
jgi:hypothetical protein